MPTPLRLMGIASLAACLAAPLRAEQITFGNQGSIFGGSQWTITPDDQVRYSAYQVWGGLSEREGWVWDNVASRQGHLTRSVPGAFAAASAIAREALTRLGPAPAFQPQCTDAGSLSVNVTLIDFTYAAQASNCIAVQSPVPAPVLDHHRALKALQQKIMAALALNTL